MTKHSDTGWAGCVGVIAFWAIALFVVLAVTGCAAPPPQPTPQVIVKTLPAPTPQIVTLPPEIREVTPVECFLALDAADAINENTLAWLDAMVDGNFDKADRISSEVPQLLKNFNTLSESCRGTQSAST